jgi:hypothetical protein
MCVYTKHAGAWCAKRGAAPLQRLGADLINAGAKSCELVGLVTTLGKTFNFVTLELCNAPPLFFFTYFSLLEMVVLKLFAAFVSFCRCKVLGAICQDSGRRHVFS